MCRFQKCTIDHHINSYVQWDTQKSVLHSWMLIYEDERRKRMHDTHVLTSLLVENFLHMLYFNFFIFLLTRKRLNKTKIFFTLSLCHFRCLSTSYYYSALPLFSYYFFFVFISIKSKSWSNALIFYIIFTSQAGSYICMFISYA